MTHIAHYITQPEIDTMTQQTQQTAKAVHALNPHKPWLRTSAEIKLDIARLTQEKSKDPNGLEGLLPQFKRQLAGNIAAREELEAALARTEKTIEDLKQMGAGPKHPRLLELTGYDFYSKTYQTMQHHAGTIEEIRSQLGAVELRIESLTEAVRNTEARVKRELPKLQAELKEALKREALGQ